MASNQHDLQNIRANPFRVSKAFDASTEGTESIIKSHGAANGPLSFGSRSKLHIPAVFAADLVERVADLAERVRFHRVHQGGEDVLALAGGGLEMLDSR